MSDLYIVMSGFLGKAQFAVIWAAYDEAHTWFTDWLPETSEAIEALHLFDSKDTLMEYLLGQWECPEDMWYWVVDLRGDEPACLCSGACDPMDQEYIENQLQEEDQK